jgi:hypothetical protein
MPRTDRLRRESTHTVPSVPTLPRADCTCIPGPTRHHFPCAACLAWDKHQVLLVDGTQVPRGSWVLAHEAPMGKEKVPC